jgi:hypothetical protein
LITNGTAVMSDPDWHTFAAGTRVRVALWLHSEVGAGGTFTKADLRSAFPGVEQIDRRMRDLRAEGWIISTYQEDRSLAPDELRLVKEGGAVWDRAYRSRRPRAVTAKERQAALRADDFACVFCGIGAREVFPEHPLRTAKLAVVHLGDAERGVRVLSTVCDLCIAGGADGAGVTKDSLLAEIDALTPDERRRLADWVRRGMRPRSKEEQLWAWFRRLPGVDRAVVERRLG